jgi:hypothetical protein
MSTYPRNALVISGVAATFIVATESPTTAAQAAAPNFESGWKQTMPLLEKEKLVQHHVILAQKSNPVKNRDPDLEAIEKELAFGSYAPKISHAGKNVP